MEQAAPWWRCNCVYILKQQGHSEEVFVDSGKRIQLCSGNLTLRYFNVFGLLYVSSCPRFGAAHRDGRAMVSLMLARLHWNTQWSYSNGKTHALPPMLTTRRRAQLNGRRAAGGGVAKRSPAAKSTATAISSRLPSPLEERSHQVQRMEHLHTARR